MSAPEYGLGVMLDIETLSSVSKVPAVIQVGACRFSIQTGVVWASAPFLASVTWESALEFGEMDADTVRWWFKQPDTARRVATTSDTVSLTRALSDLMEWVEDTCGPDPQLWGQPSLFDVAALMAACRAVNVVWPFDRWSVRCASSVRRALKEAGREFPPGLPAPLPSHVASFDAVNQATELVALVTGKVPKLA